MPLTPICSRGKSAFDTNRLEAHFVIDARYIAAPFAMKFVEQLFGDGFAAGDDFAQWVKISGFIVAAAVEAVAGSQARR